jgi:hypothetical protein
MRRLFGGDSKATSGERRKHRPYRYLVDHYGVRQWVHCPVCLSVNEGWYENGTPRYSGGVVEVKRPYSLVRGGWIEIAVACVCAAGEQRQQQPHFQRTIDEEPKESIFVTLAMPILWVRGKDSSPPPEDDEAEEDRRNQENLQLAKQTRRFMAGEINLEQFKSNVAALGAKWRQSAHGSPASLELILQTRELRHLYFLPTLEEPVGDSVDAPPERQYKDD